MVFLFASLIYYFMPPTGWELRMPIERDAYIQAAFVGEQKGLLAPCIRYTTETTDYSLKEYVQAVREQQLAQAQQPQDRWTDLGSFRTKAGEGRLIELELATELGQLRMLQVICMGAGQAHVLTGIALKEEFSSLRTIFLETFRSFATAETLFAPIADASKREQLEALFGSLGEFPIEGDRAALQEERWSSLQKLISSAYGSQGDHWQFLLLKEGYRRIYP